MQTLSPPVPATTCAGPEKSFAQAVPEFGRIYGFDVLNLGAYYGAAGPVLALYIKYLGGSPTFMGLVMACMPACQLTQLFVAPHIERWGIKRTMLASLALRNAMHTVLAILPFLAGWMLASNPLGLAQASAPGGFFGLPGATLLLVLFFVMLGFDLCQGLGFSGWMTWVTWLVPEKYRGRYFAFEQMMNNLGQMAFSGVAGWILGEQGSHGNYGSIFAIGAVCGWISLVFLGRITPSPRSADRPAAHSMDLRWMKSVWQITPFRRMMYVIWAHQLMLSVGYFFIFFQKDVLHLTDSFLMASTTVGIAGGLLSVYVWGSLADRFGSKPVMALSYYIILGINAYWVALALGLPLAQKPVLIAVQFLTVAGLQGYVVTNMRYVLGSLPKDKMVFGTVFYNLTVQVSTMVGAMLWGHVLDLSFIQNIHLTFHNFRLDRFGVVFGCMLLLAILARFMVHRLENRESQSTSAEVAWYALCNDRVTRKIFAYAAFGLAALPVSYLFQPEAVRQALDISLYCLGILQGSGNLGLPPGPPLPWRAAFLTTMSVSMLACTLLCFHRHQRRLKTLSLSSFLIATLALSLGIPSAGLAQSGAIQPAPGAGEKFRFAIVADPQVSARDNAGKVSINAQETTAQAADELNAMQPRPAFVLWAGDLVNVFEPNSVANFKRLCGLFKMPNILMNGNHDTLPPYDGYRELQKEISGVESPYYSFDVGKWHFIITPCNLQGNSKAEISEEAAMLAWLEADLEANKLKPTAFFNHLHFMPQGLTQTEWYNQPLELRKKILDLLTRHGNVKYYFNGHVHNGIKTAEKVAWEYKGIKFFTVPTIIQPRPYGEEYPEFQKGIERGGYYLLVDADGDKLTLRGRLAGVPGEHVFPATAFKPFKDEEYPLWFSRLVDLPALKEFQNGDFQAGFEHWSLPERYVRDGSPFFIAKTDGEGAQLAVETPVESIWSNDEYQQASQIVEIAPGKSPTISGRYFLPEAPKAGGGYIMAVLMGDSGLKGLMMFRWSNMESDSDYLPRSIGYQVTGHQTSWLYLQELGKKKKGMFWKLPDSANVWHPFIFNLGKLYDQTHAEGAFAKLGVTKMQFAVGVWNQNNLPDMRSEARFAKLALNYDGGESLLDNAPLPMGDDVFTCDFGKKTADQEIKNRASAIRPK